MKLLVDRLQETPTHVAFDGDDEWKRALEALVPEFVGAVREPLHVELDVHRMGRDVYVSGTLTGVLELGCSRCLSCYRHPLRESFRLVLEPVGERAPGDPASAEALERDGLCVGDELDTGWFRGPEIDLGAFLREVATLALPVQPLCREDCRGLCPRCGVDRNVESCSCREASPRSPFAALEALRRRAGEGDT